MRWTPGGRSADIEDRRGQSGRGGVKLGVGGFLLLAVLSLIFKKNFFALVGAQAPGGPGGGTASVQEGAPATSPEEEELVKYVGFVLDDVQDTWTKILADAGETYPRAKLVLFTDSTSAAGCGLAESAIGPFYCPADQKVYIDLAFYRELQERFGAPGDFAQAYVIAHELGHHVQNVLGISDKMRAEQEQEPSRANELSVRLELQADCLAGVWAHTTSQRNLLQEGDVEEALNGAAAVGDDRLQRETTGRVQPETWTHGSSEDRMRWFKTGFDTGDMERCDTFAE